MLSVVIIIMMPSAALNLLHGSSIFLSPHPQLQWRKSRACVTSQRANGLTNCPGAPLPCWSCCRLRAMASSTMVSSSASGGMSNMGGKPSAPASRASRGEGLPLFTFSAVSNTIVSDWRKEMSDGLLAQLQHPSPAPLATDCKTATSLYCVSLSESLVKLT